MHIFHTKISHRNSPALWNKVPSIYSDNSGQENTQAGCASLWFLIAFPSSCTIFPGQETQRDSNHEEDSILLSLDGSRIIQSVPTWKALLSIQQGEVAMKPCRFGVHCSLSSSVVPCELNLMEEKSIHTEKKKKNKTRLIFTNFCFVLFCFWSRNPGLPKSS